VKSQKSHTDNLANLVIQNMCIVYSRSSCVRLSLPNTTIYYINHTWNGYHRFG